MNSQPQVVVGLEIHVQLQTATKLFCSCSTQFGSPPNTQTCHICTGMPGALPVLNKRALELAIKTGLALDCQIERKTKWDRKNYFYPDLPKGYQISQFDRPICYDGHLDIVDAQGVATDRRVRIERAHLEEDAGKSNHDESGAGGDSKIDLNRAGTPLLEIVTKPDLRSAEEAKNFLTELKLILTHIGVSDCNMQSGNLRVDANVNLWIEPNVATPIVEIKNLNSFRAVERAIVFEAERQLKAYQETGQTLHDAPKQTRGWDDERQITTLQREKEDSADYRYFPDPDLVAIETTQDTIEAIADDIGRLPAEFRRVFTTEHKLPQYDADVLVKQGRALIDYFLACVGRVGQPKLVSNWIQQEVLRFLNEFNQTIEQYPVSAPQLAELLDAVARQQLDQSRGKDVLAKMVADKLDFATAKDQLGIADVDTDELETLCQQLIDQHPNVVADIKAGNAKAIGSLIGKARKTNPNVNPNQVKLTLTELIDKL